MTAFLWEHSFSGLLTQACFLLLLLLLFLLEEPQLSCVPNAPRLLMCLNENLLVFRTDTGLSSRDQIEQAKANSLLEKKCHFCIVYFVLTIQDALCFLNLYEYSMIFRALCFLPLNIN